jgi:hypothetical protein
MSPILADLPRGLPVTVRPTRCRSSPLARSARSAEPRCAGLAAYVTDGTRESVHRAIDHHVYGRVCHFLARVTRCWERLAALPRPINSSGSRAQGDGPQVTATFLDSNHAALGEMPYACFAFHICAIRLTRYGRELVATH